MKNIFLGSVFVLFLLPQVSFAATQPNQPSIATTPVQLPSASGTTTDSTLSAADQAATARYQQQALDRENYIKSHHDAVAQQDKDATMRYQKQAQDRENYIKLHHDAIVQQDKAATLRYQQQAQDRQNAKAQGDQNPVNPPAASNPSET